MIKCPVCRRMYYSTDALIDHLSGHTPKVLAETLVERLKPCGKRRFQTAAAAERALVINTISLSPNRREVRAYQCVQCHPVCWHLTSEALQSSVPS